MSGRTFALLVASLVLGAALAFALEACAPTGPQRTTARSAVDVTAHAAKALDEACARVALNAEDLELAKRCEAAYDLTRRQLLTTAAAVDAWDRSAVARADVACAARRAASALLALAEIVRTAGAELPEVVADARLLVDRLPPCEAAQ